MQTKKLTISAPEGFGFFGDHFFFSLQFKADSTTQCHLGKLESQVNVLTACNLRIEIRIFRETMLKLLPKMCNVFKYL